MEFLLKLPTGAFVRKGRLRSKLSTWLKSRDLGKYLIREGEDGGDDLAGFSHDVAVHVIPNLMTKRGTYDRDGVEITAPTFDGPHLMVRFLTTKAQAAFLKQRTKKPVLDRDGKETAPAEYALPTGVTVVENPGTVAWL